MPGADSTTRWCDHEIVPADADYEDVPGLVKLARRARQQVVEFDWAFSRDDLQRLRQAVYEWGSRSQGSYRRLNARVLAAINEALGESDTIFALNEPNGEGWLECTVTCVRDGDGFRLRGQAPFDAVFGYGEVGLQESGPGRALLGPTVKATLADSVGKLKWDLGRLQERRYQPVRNAMYGLRVNYGCAEVPVSVGPEVRVDLSFQGPFAAVDDGGCRCLFTESIADRSGIYVWTIEVDGAARPWYVGQTRRPFKQRMGEHLTKMLAGEYPPHDPEALRRGDSGRLCKGAGALSWPLTIPVLLRNWEALAPEIMAVIRLLRIHLAPLEGDAHLYDRVEGAIGRYYKSHPLPELSNFITPGLRLPAAIPGDRPMRLAATSEAPIAGLPVEILDAYSAPSRTLIPLQAEH